VCTRNISCGFGACYQQVAWNVDNSAGISVVTQLKNQLGKQHWVGKQRFLYGSPEDGSVMRLIGVPSIHRGIPWQLWCSGHRWNIRSVYLLLIEYMSPLFLYADTDFTWCYCQGELSNCICWVTSMQLCVDIYRVSLLSSLLTAALSHRQPRSTGIFRDSCRAQGHYKRGTVLGMVWLRHCATSRKVAGSIPGGVTGIFIDIILSVALWPCGRLSL
jgi:hypothetical protein